MLWFAGNRRSDTLHRIIRRASMECRGLRGIVARIHCRRLAIAPAAPWFAGNRRSDTLSTVRHSTDNAVVCGESSLGYTRLSDHICRCRLWFAGNRRSDTLRPRRFLGWMLWFAGNRRSDTLMSTKSSQYRAAVVCGESSLGYTSFGTVLRRFWLWFAGNRRSDTLRRSAIMCLVGAVVCGESSLGYTRGPDERPQLHAVVCGESSLGYTVGDARAARRLRLWFAGNRRSDTLLHRGAFATELWFAGNRRSDTLLSVTVSAAARCGLRGIVARIHLEWRSPRRTASCGLRGIVARIHSCRGR